MRIQAVMPEIRPTAMPVRAVLAFRWMPDDARAVVARPMFATARRPLAGLLPPTVSIGPAGGGMLAALKAGRKCGKGVGWGA